VELDYSVQVCQALESLLSRIRFPNQQACGIERHLPRDEQLVSHHFRVSVAGSGRQSACDFLLVHWTEARPDIGDVAAIH